MSRKQRPTATSEFINSLDIIKREEVEKLVHAPNVSVAEIWRYLNSLGFEGSLTSAYTWYGHVKHAGEKAKAINSLLEQYKGLRHEQLLEKTLFILINQLDAYYDSINNSLDKVSLETKARMLPLLCKELSGICKLLNELSFVRDKKGLELCGATRMGTSLKRLFKEEVFIDALEEGIDSILIEIEQEEG
jgi:hypothetical protein